jgi:hypothetical protein
MFNFFKKELNRAPQNTEMIGKKVDANQVAIINNKQYVIEKTHVVKCSPYTEDIKPCGWILEYGNVIKDQTFWNNYSGRIYTTRDSAIQSMIQIGKTWGRPDREWRISAIYRMEQMEYRDYLIDEIFKEQKPPKKYDLKFWKVREDAEVELTNRDKRTPVGTFKIKKGTIYCQMEDGSMWTLATPTSPMLGYVWNRILGEYLIPGNYVDEVDIMEQKWIHPHLPISLKNKFNVR